MWGRRYCLSKNEEEEWTFYNRISSACFWYGTWQSMNAQYGEGYIVSAHASCIMPETIPPESTFRRIRTKLSSTGCEEKGCFFGISIPGYLVYDTDIEVQVSSYIIESECKAVSDLSFRPRICNCPSTLKGPHDQVVRWLRQEKNEAVASNVV